MKTMTRREWLQGAAALALTSNLAGAGSKDLILPHARPQPGARHFRSEAVENLIRQVKSKIPDASLATIFENCFPNTLDTTVFPGTYEGKPDTYIVTGDIDAMWLRDSSAQVNPYLALAKQDARLRELLEGVIRRQARMILIDPYANAFMRHRNSLPLSWAVNDKTQHFPGVGERKWEVDSLCYPIRLAYAYWQQTGDTRPFDSQWKEAAATILRTFRSQQRKHGPGPYSFLRKTEVPTDTLALNGFGNPAVPVGMIFSMFRPSDDACTYSLFVPANLLAVVSLRQLATLAKQVLNDERLAQEAQALAGEVETAAQRYGKTQHPKYGEILAYEVDGYGNVLKMDDANLPGLLSLPYLGCCRLDDPLYQRTRQFVLSDSNPYFFRGTAAEGVGGPHLGLNMIWPMSIIVRALTSTDDSEIRRCLRWLRNTTAGTGFMHESFQKDNPKVFTRPWFAWANSLFGEMTVRLVSERPQVFAGASSYWN
ncbi:MAG TPA: glycoside hydrolase family 125 protein [Acidobacteriaceae bacterium]|nr:glycoside hydrolase family 125 protein [Acidobacteriaceae bacterium]